MADTLHFAVIAYDVADSADRRRVAALLEGAMVRVQGSVFEGWMGTAAAHALLEEAAALAEHADSLRCYIIPRHAVGRCRARGFPPAPEADGVLVF